MLGARASELGPATAITHARNIVTIAGVMLEAAALVAFSLAPVCRPPATYMKLPSQLERPSGQGESVDDQRQDQRH